MGTKESPYKLIVKASLKSKAKFLKLFPIKSFIAGEPFELSFEIQNISEEGFPGADFSFKIVWPSGQVFFDGFPIPPLKKTEVYKSPAITTEALCNGFGLISITAPLSIKDEQGKTRNITYYSGERVEDYIDIQSSISSVRAKTWEEIYEFWALMISAASLLIIALEKIISFILK
jgi:hypothetical protein